MSTHEQPQVDLDRFLDRMRAGEVNAAEVADLEARLLADPDLRRRYRARVRLEAGLLAAFRAAQPDLVPPLMAEHSGRWRGWIPAVGLGIAAALVLGFFVGSGTNQVPQEPVVARLESVSEAEWSGRNPSAVGEALGAGTLELRSGLAELRFESGVLLSLEAPARLELVDPMRCRLHRGTAMLDVPDSGKGFIVETPGGHAVDHGTRFVVNVGRRADTAEFAVLSGRISVHHARSGAVKDLVEPKAARLTADGIETLESEAFGQLQGGADVGLRRLRTGGRETSIIRHTEASPDEVLLDPDFLMVKRDGWRATRFPKDRRALVGFPLEGIDPRKVGTARLRLNLVPTGLGLASLLPEVCTFAVYGIRDDAALETWPTENLRWEDAPGSVGQQGDIDLTEVTLLGSFDLPRGKTSGPVVFESPALADFIRNDTTGEVGFLLVRETAPLNTWSLVHGFASSRHPEASGPMLELDLQDSE